MRRRITTVADVSDRHLCSGCGACAGTEPDSIAMVDIPDRGLRPQVTGPGARAAAERSLEVCPGVQLGHSLPHHPDAIPELLGAWGPVLEVWEGYAGDEQVRWSASSGGAATALALHGLEHGRTPGGVVHIAASSDDSLRNETVISRDRAQLLAATGSRYAPASPCDRLNEVRDGGQPVVLIGKPCDVAGARKAADRDPALARNLGLLVAVFCAGTPSSNGTREMLRAMGVRSDDQVTSLRYRGNGWPGDAVVEYERNGESRSASLTYEQSWGAILHQHRPWRCHVCADHTGEFADIAVGDPWYREVGPGEAGNSLILARTEAGRTFLQQAVASGALVAEPADPELLARSQPNLLVTRGAVWGRTTMTRMVGIPAPRYENMPTFSSWRSELTLRQQAQAFYGTAKRIVTKRLYRRAPDEGKKFRAMA